MSDVYRLLRRFGMVPDLQSTAALRRPARMVRYARQWRAYRALSHAEQLRFVDCYPCLEDGTTATFVEAHYFSQAVWASRLVVQARPNLHVDVGSDHSFVGVLSSSVRVAFVDIRPLPVSLSGLEQVVGSVLQLPFATDSVRSLSCLHVAEHVGLGRYGDPLNPLGTREAARELARVIAPGGDLYFSLPIGRPRVEFNAHRIHSPHQVIDMFTELQLMLFSAEDDLGKFHTRADKSAMNNATYACGMFWFRKPIQE